MLGWKPRKRGAEGVLAAQLAGEWSKENALSKERASEVKARWVPYPQGHCEHVLDHREIDLLMSVRLRDYFILEKGKL